MVMLGVCANTQKRQKQSFQKQILSLSPFHLHLTQSCVIMPLSFTESEGDPTVDTNEGSVHPNRSW